MVKKENTKLSRYTLELKREAVGWSKAQTTGVMALILGMPKQTLGN